MDHNQQGTAQGRGRRGHFQRGRRGPDRRGPGGQEQRPSQPSESQPTRGEHADVEQIMRDIRARIAQRHGIDLSAPQIRELAARRLDAILDPRNVSPSLLEQLRNAAGDRQATNILSAKAEPAYSFEDTTLYETHRGLLRTVRKLLNPILRLFFNPNPIVHALNAQARLNVEPAARESEREQRQAEWNALHYELLRRVVTESAKLSIELQALTLRVESLSARVDFTDRRVRTLEAAPAPRHGGRPPQEPQSAPVQTASVTSEPRVDSPPVTSASEPSSLDGQRKRRRRRRGRRSGGSFGEGSQAQAEASGSGDVGADQFDDAADDVPDEGASDASPLVVSQDTAATGTNTPSQASSQSTEQSPASPTASQPAPADGTGSPESAS